ncbi:MAG: thioredoxin family protein [Cyclobacteriaceae bacterium]|nr:thioredoxin family protein [Cyclobacteriaceae bacterium]
MARIPSTMIPLGTRAPEFTLPDTVSGKELSLNDIKGEKGTLVMFICNHCPFVIHVNEQLVQLGNDYQPNGINLIAINSNDVKNYPEDNPEKMTLVAKKLGYPFPYLFDDTQEVAKAYDAACTPDFFLFDAEMRLVYRGQLDGARPGNDVPITGVDLREAMDALLYGEEITQDQKPSMGCSIKWR